MAKNKKVYRYSTSGGINRGTSEGDGAYIVKNMISVGGKNRKRQGHQNICTIYDENMTPLRINGIYDYAYLDSEGNSVKQKIVHAGQRLFILNEGFAELKEIELSDGITLKDQRSQAFIEGERLWIVGAGDLLIYNGESIKSAYEHENAYVPNTTISTNDTSISSRNQYSNILTQKRINTFVGTTLFRETGAVSIFVLDERVKYGTDFLLEVKIRTRTSEGEANDTTTSYIGVDPTGKEVDRIVTLRFARSKISEYSHYFLAEPIKDESGNIINFKIDDEICTFDKLPFGITIKNGREVRASFDTTPPSKGESNVYIEYIAEQNGEKELLNKLKMVAVANGDKGGEKMLLNFGDNKIYFTDEKIGFFYLPSNNIISLGSDGEKISAMVKLSDNLVGVFMKNRFYRIKFTSSNSDGYEIISSTDALGAYSHFSSAVVDYDCLVLNDRGVFGVSEYNSSTNVFNCLRQRGSKIKALLEGYTKEEKESAQAISYNARYYLFIGKDAYIADTRRKTKESGASSDAYEYEWWMWDNCQARVLYTDGIDLYFGTENGQIRKFTNEMCDIERHEYNEDSLSLLLKDDGTYTTLVIPSPEAINFEIARATLSAHKRMISQRAVFENGTLYFAESDLFFEDGSVKLYKGDTLEAYDKDGNFISAFEIKSPDILLNNISIENATNFENGHAYDVYLSCPQGYSYEICQEEKGVSLLNNGEKIKVMADGATLVIKEEAPIECIYKSNIISFDEEIKNKSLYKLYLKPTSKTVGEVKILLQSEKSSLEKTITLADSISFDQLCLDNISFRTPFDNSYPLSVFLRDFENLTLEIKSKTTTDFGLECVNFLYSVAQKPRF